MDDENGTSREREREIERRRNVGKGEGLCARAPVYYPSLSLSSSLGVDLRPIISNYDRGRLSAVSTRSSTLLRPLWDRGGFQGGRAKARRRRGGVDANRKSHLYHEARAPRPSSRLRAPPVSRLSFARSNPLPLSPLA